MIGASGFGQTPVSKADGSIPLHGVAIQAGTDTTYRVVALNGDGATVVRCTRDNVVYPGALPRKVTMDEFRAWLPYLPTNARAPHPDDF